ncbi:MAG: gliding motility-associated lipoprotein GldD [Luteibaculaceae bacterium]|jgi:gliding motility-associated lipoprotein GldD
MRLGVLLLLILGVVSCGQTPIPKPFAYHRAEFPQREIINIPFPNSPFSFDAPRYSRFSPDPGQRPGMWLWTMPELKAEIFLSYHRIDTNFDGLVRDAFTLMQRHQVKASNVEMTPFTTKNTLSGGLIFRIEGPVACPYQFFITDSLSHFIRAELYFKSRPNPDSLQPALTHVLEDLRVMRETLVWGG